MIQANINYKLTNAQENASIKILEHVKNNQSVIVNAVCGAGKTELVYKSIEYFLNNNKKIAFAIPRKDVVIEIYSRLKHDYPLVNITCVYGGNSNVIEGQIVVLTTHQLYRYEKYFSLLILDEADAYPFYGNDLLKHFLKQAVIGPIIYLSATIKDSYKKECQNIVYVNKRFHGHKLPVPEIIKYNNINKVIVLKKQLDYFLSFDKQVLIFVPTIAIGKVLEHKIKIDFVYSSKENKQEIINKFKNRQINYLITTSILERGITISDVQVIVYDANHELFDCASLIQISGRVGRKYKAPDGKVIFLSTSVSQEMKQCIKEITMKNETFV